MKPKVYFNDILRSGLFPLFLLPVIFLNLPFTWIFYAFLLSLVLPCVALIIYAIKRLPLPLRPAISISSNPVAKDLLLFSLPLLSVGVFTLLMTWTDTLMLGYFKASVDVGLYNIASPLARLISSPSTALTLIYVPIISELYAHKAMPEIRRNFSVLAKWLWSATLPLFLIFLVFPEAVISLLFGASYAPAADTLRILSLGFIINNFLVLNEYTLLDMPP